MGDGSWEWSVVSLELGVGRWVMGDGRDKGKGKCL